MKLSTANISRRRVLGTTLAVAGLAAARPLQHAFAGILDPTPRQGMGPFYPEAKPLDQDNDLTFIQGKTGRAQGRLLHVVGRVFDSAGNLVKDARVEIWQANSFGRYDHPRDRRDVPLDPNFQGYGHDITNSDGAYHFRTIEPAPYPASATWMRPPHIHFVISDPRYPRFVTQMYFAGNPLNARDAVLNGISDPSERARLIVPLQPPTPELDPDSTLATFDIVLGSAKSG
ncbi:MAG: protocatechuate 3,4-dioxygenase [Alphaproteobacteria bacterium]